MSEDEKGKRFLELIEKQNKIQWDIIQTLFKLIGAEWNSSDLKEDIEKLMKDYSKISDELNGLDESNSLL